MVATQIQACLARSGASLILLASFWPVWCWYAQRTFDKSDEPWGLLALASAAYFVWQAGKESTEGARPRRYTFTSLALLAAYVLTFSIAPHLVQGILLVATLWFWLGGRLTVAWRWAILGLLLLSLPVIPSINFFVGYPMRLLVTQAAQWMLACVGIDAVKDGTLIIIAGKPLSIDAPCSGISMLWVELYTAMVLACHFKLNWVRTAALTCVSLALVLLSNSIRVTALIIFDLLCHLPNSITKLSEYEPAVHVGVGVVAFIAMALATTFIAMKLSARGPKPSTESQVLSSITPLSISRGNVCVTVLTYALCLGATLIPFAAPPTSGVQLPLEEPSWPIEIMGHPVTAVKVLGEERAFAADFPGQMRRFTDGVNSYFVRVVNRETRQLHPSSDCFKGLGYTIKSQPLVVSSDGTRWGSFSAQKGNESYLVMEQIHDTHGHTWTDVSEWYWHALMHENEGPWWAITVAQPR